MKKFFLVLLGGLLIFKVYADDYSIIEKNNRKGLMDQHGKILIPPQFDELGWSKGTSRVVDEIIGYKMGDFWGLISVKNIKITIPEYIELYPFDEDHLIAARYDSHKLNILYGLISYSGKNIMDFRFSLLKEAGDNLIAASKSGTKIKYGLMDIKGKMILPFQYGKIDFYPPGLLTLIDDNHSIYLSNTSGSLILDMPMDNIESVGPDNLIITQKGMTGLVACNGQLICMPEYRNVKLDRSGMVSIIPLSRWKTISLNNDQIATLDYDQVIPLDKNLYKTRRNNFSFIVNSLGEEIFNIKNSDITVLNDSLALIKPGLRYGVIDYHGKQIIPAIYDSIRISRDRLFLLSGNGKTHSWMIANLAGKVLSAIRYHNIYHIDPHYLAVKRNNFWGITDHLGNPILEAIYDSVYTYEDGHFLVNFHGEIGVVDRKENWIAYPRPGDLYILARDIFLVSSADQSNVIDFYGNELFESQGYLEPLVNGFLERNYRGKYGLINKYFQPILPALYDSIAEIKTDSVYIFHNEKGWGTVDWKGKIMFSNDQRFQKVLGFSEEYIGVKIDGKYGFVDLNGKLRIANRYDGIDLYQEGLADISLLGKWGCVDKNEVLVIQPYYDKVFPFVDHLAIAQKNGRFGIIDNEGTVKINFEYDSIYRLQEGGFICTMNGKFGLINKEAMMKFYPKFDEIRDLLNGYILASRKQKYGVFNSEGVITVPLIYDKMIYDRINNVLLISMEKSWEKLTYN